MKHSVIFTLVGLSLLLLISGAYISTTNLIKRKKDGNIPIIRNHCTVNVYINDTNPGDINGHSYF